MSPFENNNDNFTEYLYIIIGTTSLDSIEDYTSNHINYLKGNLTNFQLLNSTETTLSSNPAHKIIYTYKDNQYNWSCHCDLKVMAIITLIDNKEYLFIYLQN